MSAHSRDLDRRIAEAAALTGDFVLRSGERSTRYFDKYLFESDPALLREIAAAMARLVPPGTQALAGLELGGVPLAVALSALTDLPTRFVRKQAKEYGTRRLAEGGEVEGLRLAVVEDVVTSGGQVLASCGALRERGAVVEHVLCAIDREAGGREALAERGLELRAMTTRSALEAVIPAR